VVGGRRHTSPGSVLGTIDVRSQQFESLDPVLAVPPAQLPTNQPTPTDTRQPITEGDAPDATTTTEMPVHSDSSTTGVVENANVEPKLIPITPHDDEPIAFVLTVLVITILIKILCRRL
jgi:hypothetical protein